MRQILQNKAAKQNILVTLGAVALIVIAIAAVYMVYESKSQTEVGGTPTGTVAGEGCSVNPSLVTAFVDQLTPGTSISPSANYRVNGIFTGTTAPTYKGTADILYNASGYLNTIVSGKAIGCNANLVSGTMLAYTNSSLTYLSSDGLHALVFATVNETAATAGGSYNWALKMQGVDKKSTGKQLLIVELSVPANVSSLSLSGGSEVAVPNGYTRQLTNGYAKAFLLPAITGNTKVEYDLAAAAATGKVIAGTVYTTILSVEPFIDVDGTFSDVGAAYNSLNVAKFHDSQTKNFIIV